jgi:peroxiredoxin Q/BCP
MEENMKKSGEIIANFTLNDADGKPVSLKDFSGKKKVIYFYPKDDTPGCTKEACGFRDSHGAILAKGAAVLGISADDEKSHTEFRAKYNLPFPLLSDPDMKVIKEFGSYGEKSMYGKTYLGILRTTFILDENDRVVKVFEKVQPEGHTKEVLEALG